MPRNQRAIVGWVVGWLNILGQIAGLASTEFGLAGMIWAAVVVGRVSSERLQRACSLPTQLLLQGDDYPLSSGKTVGLFAALMVLHGILVGGLAEHRRCAWLMSPQNCLATRQLARLTSGFVFVNIGATLSAFIFSYLCSWDSPTNTVIIVVLLATTPRSEMHPAAYVFGSQGIINQTSLDGKSGWNTGLAFLFGLLSVQWTVSNLG